MGRTRELERDVLTELLKTLRDGLYRPLEEESERLRLSTCMLSNEEERRQDFLYAKMAGVCEVLDYIDRRIGWLA